MNRLYEYLLLGALIVVAVIAAIGVIGVGAPPEPTVQAELIRPEQIEIPRISYICSQTGEEAMVYSDSEGRVVINPTDRPCDYAAWVEADGPQNPGW